MKSLKVSSLPSTVFAVSCARLSVYPSTNRRCRQQSGPALPGDRPPGQDAHLADPPARVPKSLPVECRLSPTDTESTAIIPATKTATTIPTVIALFTDAPTCLLYVLALVAGAPLLVLALLAAPRSRPLRNDEPPLAVASPPTPCLSPSPSWPMPADSPLCGRPAYRCCPLHRRPAMPLVHSLLINALPLVLALLVDA